MTYSSVLAIECERVWALVRHGCLSEASHFPSIRLMLRADSLHHAIVLRAPTRLVPMHHVAQARHRLSSIAWHFVHRRCLHPTQSVHIIMLVTSHLWYGWCTMVCFAPTMSRMVSNPMHQSNCKSIPRPWCWCALHVAAPPRRAAMDASSSTRGFRSVTTPEKTQVVVERRWDVVVWAFVLGWTLGYLLGWHRTNARWKKKKQDEVRRGDLVAKGREEATTTKNEVVASSDDLQQQEQTAASVPESIQRSVEGAVERCCSAETLLPPRDMMLQPSQSMTPSPAQSEGLPDLVQQFSSYATQNQLDRAEYIQMAQLVIKWRKCQLEEKHQQLQERVLHAQKDSLSVQKDANTIAKDNLDLSANKFVLQKKQDKRQRTKEGVQQFRRTFADDLFTGLSVMVLSLVLAGWHLGCLADISGTCEDLPALSSLSMLVLEMVPGIAQLRWGICMAFAMGQVTLSFLVLLLVSYWLLRRGIVSKYQSTPVTILVVLLGFVGGGVGKFVVDGVGGHGVVWMLLWELFLISHVLAVKHADVIYRLVGLHRRKLRFLPPFLCKLLLHGALALVLPLFTSIAPFLWPSGPSHRQEFAGANAAIPWNL